MDTPADCLPPLLESNRRLVAAHADGLALWGRVNGIDVDAAAPVMRQMVASVTGLFVGMEAIDRLFRLSAMDPKSPKGWLAEQAEFVRGGMENYAGLAAATLKSVNQLPPDARPPLSDLAELERVRSAAAELADVYAGEASYFRGEPGLSWDEVRKALGV